MEHTVHLGARAFIEGIYPSKQKSSKAKKAKHGDDDEDVDSDPEDPDAIEDEDTEGEEEGESEGVDEFAWMDEHDAIPDDDDSDEPVDFEPGDLLGKVLALINQVIR